MDLFKILAWVAAISLTKGEGEFTSLDKMFKQKFSIVSQHTESSMVPAVGQTKTRDAALRYETSEALILNCS